MAILENVNGFLAVNTPPDDLIRTDFEQEGVVAEGMLHIFKEFILLLGWHPFNNEIPRMEENPSEQSWFGILLVKQTGHHPGYLRKVLYESSIEDGVTEKATDTLDVSRMR
nr:hypothetical protein [Tanacetum cinerariifolium]